MPQSLYLSGSADPEASAMSCYERGRTLQSAGAVAEAARHFRQSLAILPSLPHAALAQALIDEQHPAIKLRRALAMQRDFPEAHTALAHSLMPGEDYYGVLARLHEALRPKLYVEIGIRQGKSLALARPPTLAVGIDPMPRIDRGFDAETIIHGVTSDVYFDHPDIHDFHRRSPIDMAFIDGLHVFEQALRDVLNVERFAAPGAVAVVHDCIPLDEATSSRQQSTLFYSGDVWRVIPSLRKARPNLRFLLVKTPPTGIALITGLDPGACMPADDIAVMVRDGLGLGLPSLFEGQAVACEWSEVAAFLGRTSG